MAQLEITPTVTHIPEDAAGRNLFARLRHETAEAHQRLETRLALTGRVWDRERYRDLLARFYGFYEPWERQVYSTVKSLLPGRAKVPLLAADLQQLQCDSRHLPLCPEIRAPRNRAEALGSMYVIEGSTLGGQLILRHLQRSAAAEIGHACRFFGSYGTQVGAQWKAFQSAVIHNTCEADDPSIIGAANATFHLLSRWLLPWEELSL